MSKLKAATFPMAFLIPRDAKGQATTIIDPESRLPLPPGGGEKPLNAYWRRRVAKGVVQKGVNPNTNTAPAKT